MGFDDWAVVCANVGFVDRYSGSVSSLPLGFALVGTDEGMRSAVWRFARPSLHDRGIRGMDPVEEASLDRASNCSFGEPGTPMMAGKPMSNVAEISVITGGDDYYAGPVAQVNAIFDMAAKNAGEVEVVEALGERAHWTPGPPFYTLRVVQGPYLVEVSVDPDFGGRQAAEQIARNALQELP